MPRHMVLVAVLAVGVVAACDGDPKAVDDVVKPSFAHATVDELSGTFFFLVPRDDGATVYSFTDGEKPEPLLTGGPSLLTSANPSPDGKYISYVDDDHTLRIWDVKAERSLEPAKPDVDPNCREPVWGPDSKRVFTHTYGPESESEAAWFDVPSGKETNASTIPACHARFPATDDRDTTTYTYLTGLEGTLFTWDGGKETFLPAGTIKGRNITDLVSVARDNAGVCVATAPPDEGGAHAVRSLSCDTILDTKTEKPVKLPDTITGAVFPESGGFIVRTGDGELKLSDLDKNGIATVKEPAQLAEGFLLGYAEPK